MSEIDQLDIAQVVEERLPERYIPKWCVRLLASILHQGDINKLFAYAKGKTDMAFIDVCMDYLCFTCEVVGEEHLPADGRPLIFVSNHPQGGAEAICIAYVLGHKYDGKIKFYANEILSILTPLKGLFLPIHRDIRKSRINARVISDFYQTDNHLILFPAGRTAYKSKGAILEHPWQKSFIKSAIDYKRDIIPLYFEAKNSNLFYLIENFRRAIRSKIKFDVLLFAHEFFKQRGNTFKLHIGKPIPWQTFTPDRSPREWANLVREETIQLPTR